MTSLVSCRLVWVVQDAETGEFLCPREGDVGHTHQLREAGHFVDIESAFETGSDYLDHPVVHTLYLPPDTRLNTN